MLKPPTKKTRASWVWSETGKFKLRHLPTYIASFFVRRIARFLHLDKKTLAFVKKGLEMGNPSETVWPSETIPMVSRLLAGGFWNYSFFQFHRHFYFPYWAHEQYNPSSKAFIPRSHNVLSINQTHRNWVSFSFP